MQFRCSSCRQLQFKYKTRGEKVEVEVKCYACNHYNYFTVWLSKLLGVIKKNNHEKSN